MNPRKWGNGSDGRGRHSYPFGKPCVLFGKGSNFKVVLRTSSCSEFLNAHTKHHTKGFHCPGPQGSKRNATTTEANIIEYFQLYIFVYYTFFWWKMFSIFSKTAKQSGGHIPLHAQSQSGKMRDLVSFNSTIYLFVPFHFP